MRLYHVGNSKLSVYPSSLIITHLALGVKCYNKSMKNLRKQLGDKLFKLAKDVYPEGGGSDAKKKLGNALFKLAAAVYPDKK